MRAGARQQYLNKMYDDLNHNIDSFYIEQTEEKTRAIDILMIEDNISDIECLQKRLKELGIRHNIISLDSHETAIQYLSREQPYQSMPIPDMIFIDMSADTIKGDLILDFLNDDVVLQKLPVFTAFEDRSILQAINGRKINYMCKLLKPLKTSQLKEGFKKLSTTYQFLSPQFNLGNG
jgi:response regulator RpfG family c-di-GMP phosphodiesterase